jgi:hypothetical protein
MLIEELGSCYDGLLEEFRVDYSARTNIPKVTIRIICPTTTEPVTWGRLQVEMDRCACAIRENTQFTTCVLSDGLAVHEIDSKAFLVLDPYVVDTQDREELLRSHVFAWGENLTWSFTPLNEEELKHWE